MLRDDDIYSFERKINLLFILITEFWNDIFTVLVKSDVNSNETENPQINSMISKCTPFLSVTFSNNHI